MSDLRASPLARFGMLAALGYGLVVLAIWLIAPLLLPAGPLLLTRPLSAVIITVLAAIALRGEGAAPTGTTRVAASAVLAASLTSAAFDVVADGGSRGSPAGPWAPYLGDSRLWVSAWAALPAACIAAALLLARTRPRPAAALQALAITLAYASIVAWSAGAAVASGLPDGVRSFPGTQLALLVVAASSGRLAALPLFVVDDAPDTRTARRWEALLVGAAVLPVVVTALATVAARSPLGIAEGNAVVGLAMAVSLVTTVGLYIRADRRARELERDVVERAQARALHDPLTGLANRTLALEALSLAMARSRRADRAVTALFCDLDGLKRVNDTFGHAVGDALIHAVADRLVGAVREEDTVARIGGDEFLVVSERLVDTAERTALADRVLTAVAEPLRIDGLALRPAVSIGVAVAEPGEDPLEVIGNADAAMYRAKTGGRSRWEIFDPRMRTEAREQARIAGQLRDAVLRHEIVVHLQPIVRLSDRRVVAAEALARWRHPERGVLEPDGWLEVAAGASHLVAIGRLVIATACSWIAEAGDGIDYVSVNLSARELARSDLASFCADQARLHGIEPCRLAFEVRESTLLASGTNGRAQLERLVADRWRLFIDGFGAGPDSLGAWCDLPVSGIKLDRTVTEAVEDPSATRITAAGAGLAAGLRIIGVAAGIETDEQAMQVSRLGWEFGQGFLFGRPAPTLTA